MSVVATLEQHMEATSERTENPNPSDWKDPGEGHLDRDIWRNPEEAAGRWYTSASTVRKYAKEGRIPSIVTLGRFRFFHIELIEAIRAELLNGRTFEDALAALNAEPTQEPTQES